MSNAFQIGSWLVLPSLNTLSLDGEAVHLEPKVMEVLVCLAEAKGEPVLKEKLLQAVWPDTFVTDDVLFRCISELRRAFHDDPKEPKFIETIPKRGYRTVAPVWALTDLELARSPQAGATPIRPGKSLREIWKVNRVAIPVLLLFATATIFAVNVGGIRSRLWTGRSEPTINSLAVLPLRSLSSDPQQEYFSEGLTDALTTELSQISSIKVVSRTSSVGYLNTGKRLGEIAHELGVNGIVEGSVQRSGDRVRVTAQLIYAPEDRHLWAKSYERDSQNVLALEQDIASAIAKEIRATLTPREMARLTRRRTVPLAALEAFVQARYHADQAEGARYRKGLKSVKQRELETAREFFAKAIQEDPAYAQAYVGLAKTWQDEPVSQQGPTKAEELARKAIALDPELAEAHEVLATLDVLRLWHWQEAEQEYRRAIELNPNSAEAHARFAEYLDCMRRFDEGMAEFLRAQELDPGHDFQPNPFYRRRQYDRAIQVNEGQIQRKAFGFWAHMDLAYDYDAAGRHDEAAKEWEEMIRLLDYTDLADSMRRGREQSGYKGALRALVGGLEASDSQGDPPPAFFVAIIYTLLGQRDQAFAWLERGYRERSQAYSALNVDPCWDQLRSDPRFADLVRRVGLPH